MRLLKRTASALRSGSGKTDDTERRDSDAAASGEAVRMAGPREGRSARCARKARARLGAAFSLVLAGTLAIGLCGGSPATIAALAAEGGAAASAAAAGAAVNDTPKEEVVYARLSAAGAVDNVYVVNVLKPNAPGTVVDYGPYTAVQNLTDASGIEQQGDAVSVDVAEDSLSYQGDLGAAALPWDVSVTYELDGKRVDATDLGGASGKLAIIVTTKKDASVDPAFFDNYLLQITVPFVSDQVKEVATEDGQIALAGSNTQVTFTGMPGKDGTFRVEAQVSGFTMSGITFAVVPFSMGIETPDTTELVSGFRQLGDGVGELKAGADGLASGASDLAAGVGQVAGGVDGLAAGAGQLVGGANELTGGAQGVAAGAQGLAEGAAGLSGGLGAYQNGLLAQAQAQQDQAEDIDTLQQELQVAIGTYTFTYQAVYQTLIDAQVPPDQAKQQALVADAVRAAAQGIGAVVQRIGTASGSLGAADALKGAASGLGSGADPQSLMGGAFIRRLFPRFRRLPARRRRGRPCLGHVRARLRREPGGFGRGSAVGRCRPAVLGRSAACRRNRHAVRGSAGHSRQGAGRDRRHDGRLRQERFQTGELCQREEHQRLARAVRHVHRSHRGPVARGAGSRRARAGHLGPPACLVRVGIGLSRVRPAAVLWKGARALERA